ncbi:hypothetical protein [Methylobacterium gregans]|uniref:hypothetical protein n=1 Tax=Methylobacterium gregans TaxID=374424 RepID=UPI001EE25F75|nr:hypothetical protein [Methylobacterium gregans]MDQ0520306.1 hypothetical protein [Methylobacterium gregans]GLS52709.1 hypothetical protein GCM10007886_08920 [Methylobacterium gregans]
MPDPATIGTLAASALAIAAPEILKASIGETVKDAYKNLKDLISTWAKSDVEELINDPSSQGRSMIIAEKVDKRSAEEQQKVKYLADQLFKELEGQRSVGLDIENIKTKRVELGNITAYDGIGARIHDSEIDEKLKTGDITVGRLPGKR